MSTQTEGGDAQLLTGNFQVSSEKRVTLKQGEKNVELKNLHHYFLKLNEEELPAVDEGDKGECSVTVVVDIVHHLRMSFSSLAKTMP